MRTSFGGQLQWTHSADTPSSRGAALLVVVDAGDVPTFAARLAADPGELTIPSTGLEIVPPGARSLYCFIEVQQSRSSEAVVQSAGIDFCADPAARDSVLSARDSGVGTYDPVPAQFGGGLSVQVPIYSKVEVAKTVAARQAAYIGQLAVQLDPALLLTTALQDHAGIAVTLHYRDAISAADFASGAISGNTQTTTIDFDNGWTTQTFAVAPAEGLFASTRAVLLFLAGLILTGVLAAFVFVLATGRSRAMRLVVERTGELQYQALHDTLTGLPNRALIMDRIEQLLARNRRHGTSGAALFVDLDDFKNVNDTLGHEAGDRLLMAVATRLSSALRDADTIGRMGGDEFVVLIDGASLQVAPELVAERLLEVMRQPFELAGASMPLTVNTSVGIAIGDRANPGDLFRDADVALYQAKAAGKNRYEVFHAEMQSEILRRVELEFDLRSAIEHHQFRLVYQPIYNLEDLTIIGVEALLRWDHPTRGVIQPDAFIPMLEQTGQIHEVGRWVLLHACEQMAAWHNRGNTLDISINVSGRQLDSDGIVGDIENALIVSGLDPSTLIIEITETALMRNTVETARRLRELKRLGIRIAIDDFGTGYSSLAYLQQFPVDCLKIDRMFTSAINSSPESKALISTLVQLGKDLGLRTLAEGVETTDEMDHLRSENVNEAQGFLLSHPLDPETLETKLLQLSRPAQQTT